MSNESVVTDIENKDVAGELAAKLPLVLQMRECGAYLGIAILIAVILVVFIGAADLYMGVWVATVVAGWDFFKSLVFFDGNLWPAHIIGLMFCFCSAFCLCVSVNVDDAKHSKVMGAIAVIASLFASLDYVAIWLVKDPLAGYLLATNVLYTFFMFIYVVAIWCLVFSKLDETE